MTGKSHLIAGTTITAAALHQANFAPASGGIFWAAALAIGMIASLLPDIDARNPLIRSLVQGGGRPRLTQLLIGQRIRRRFPVIIVYLFLALCELLIRYTLAGLMGIVPNLVQHRGPTHYLVTAVGLTAVFWAVSYQLNVSSMYALAFGAGYLSHIWTDTMTRSGVRLFAPLTQKRYHALPRTLRLATGRRQNVAELLVLLWIGVGAGLAFAAPPAIYLPLVGAVILSMFVMTAALGRLRPQPARLRQL
jgi:membrane-bound metal-dependent hydrolase YbcI (DUF457 family)